MDLFSKSEHNQFTLVCSSLRNFFKRWWLTNHLWVSWTALAAPLCVAMAFETTFRHLLPYLLLTPLSILAAYLIYRTATSRLKAKTLEVEALGRLHLATAEALATAIDAKDQTSHCHVRRVQIYAEGIGKLLNLSNGELAALNAGALLHDVGKLAVPDHILNKPGTLTPAEFEKMKVHTNVGAEILSRVNFPYPVLPIVKHHHERWDGRGYPDWLMGDRIPITARIMSVIDCFDSVREDRPFRPGMTREEAIDLLRKGAGTHFDPREIGRASCRERG